MAYPIPAHARAIPFSPAMLKANRAGLKSQTRRIADIRVPQDTSTTRRTLDLDAVQHIHILNRNDPKPTYQLLDADHNFLGDAQCPYGRTGDLLYVKEAWRTLAIGNDLPPKSLPDGTPIWYEADGPAPYGYGRYRNSRFMMRKQARMVLEIGAVQLERLHEITVGDAIAEGIEPYEFGGVYKKYPTPAKRYAENGYVLERTDYVPPVASYQSLWESINGPGSWALNPFVWVVSYKIIHQ